MFIAAMKHEASPLMVVDFLHKLIRMFRTYIGVVSENKIRSNFSIIYQVGLCVFSFINSFLTKLPILVFLLLQNLPSCRLLFKFPL